MVKGEQITLGEKEYLLPPIPIIHMGIVTQMQKGGNISDPTYIGVVVDVIYNSLLRNYPDLQRTVVEANLDLVNFVSIMDKFKVVNGMRATKPGEAPAASQ